MVNFFMLVSCILATLAMVVFGQSQAEAPGPAGTPTVDCMSLIYDMADCLAYLSVDGGENKPDKSCCSGFKTVYNTDSDCICIALKSSASLGIEVNMTSAMALPSACGVRATLNCNMSTSPTTSPPSTSPDKSPAPPTTPPTPNTPTTAPTPATKTPTSAAHSIPVGGPAPSPMTARSGSLSICATTLSTLFTIALSVSIFNIC